MCKDGDTARVRYSENTGQIIFEKVGQWTCGYDIGTGPKHLLLTFGGKAGYVLVKRDTI